MQTIERRLSGGFRSRSTAADPPSGLRTMAAKTAALAVLMVTAVAQQKPTGTANFYNGVDLSYVAQAESQGFRYRATAGAPPGDPVKIVASNGANIARLRIWNDPPYPNQTYANVSNVIKLAKRVHAAGMMVHLDFMYSCV
jgi:arabinogalactan endo-1,4-beta-galactosidase